MEAERKASGLEGVLFRYYSCPACGHADIFVDVTCRAGEMPEGLHRRRQELAEAFDGLRAEQVDVVLNEKQPRGIP
jgi:hypothetical protein